MLPPSARDQIGKTTRVASISPVTSATARELGLPVDVEARTYTWEGILDAIVCRSGFPA